MLCGIDEAGRGSIAGPLVIAGVILHKSLDGITDSKLLSEKKRVRLYTKIIENSTYHIVKFSSKEIDNNGLSYCMHKGLEIIKTKLPHACYLFDGNTTFGVDGIKTMIKADLKIKEVGAASILAKVTRDEIMTKIALDYPHYGFEKNKGYGSKKHIEAIRKFGRCPIHRKSFRIKAIDELTLFRS